MKTFICPTCSGALIDVVAGYCNTCRRTTVQTDVPPALYLVNDTTPAPPERTQQQRQRAAFPPHSIEFAQ